MAGPVHAGRLRGLETAWQIFCTVLGKIMHPGPDTQNSRRRALLMAALSRSGSKKMMKIA